jgi:hypothetical protein
MVGWQVNDGEQTRTTIQAFSGIKTHGLGIQAIKAYASDRLAAGTFPVWITGNYVYHLFLRS